MNKFIRQVIFLKWNVISIAKKNKDFFKLFIGPQYCQDDTFRYTCWNCRFEWKEYIDEAQTSKKHIDEAQASDDIIERFINEGLQSKAGRTDKPEFRQTLSATQDSPVELAKAIKTLEREMKDMRDELTKIRDLLAVVVERMATHENTAKVDSSSCNGATPTSELKEIKRVESSCVNRDKNYW